MVSNLEQWKPTADAWYEVSNLGNVRSISRSVQCGPLTATGARIVKETLLRPFISKSTGYFQVNLSKRKRVTVHRLVAEAFCEGYFDGAYVNHKNGIRTDNRAENLEWCTQSENNLHAFRQLGRKPTSTGKFGKDHPVSKPVKMTCLKTGQTEFFYSGSDISRKYHGISSSGISRCCYLKSKSHKGFAFEFVDPEHIMFKKQEMLT